MKTYRIFTIAQGDVYEGAKITDFALKSGDKIPAIVVGEQGRNRQYGILPVQNPPRIPCSDRLKEFWWDRHCNQCMTPYVGEDPRTHPDEGLVYDRLHFAGIGETKAGRPKLIAATAATDTDHVICVLRTPMGFRGGNEHTGDCVKWVCDRDAYCDARSSAPGEPKTCPKCGFESILVTYSKFPGQILTEGKIAQGDAGRMGSGQQLIALIPADVVFRTGYFGRLYGKPASHYYKWTGEKLLSATWEERMVTDIF